MNLYHVCLSPGMRKPIWFSEQARHEMGCAKTKEGNNLETLDFKVDGLYFILSNTYKGIISVVLFRQSFNKWVF